MRTTLTGVFADSDGALRAAEQLRELDYVGTLRPFLPGIDGRAVETLLVEERSPWLRLSVCGAIAGLLSAYVAFSIAPSVLLAIVALLSGVAGGVLLGSWLGGQRHRRELRPHMRTRYLELTRRGRAVVLAELISHDDGEARQLMEEHGAYVSAGHWPVGDGGMLPA